MGALIRSIVALMLPGLAKVNVPRSRVLLNIPAFHTIRSIIMTQQKNVAFIPRFYYTLA